MKPNRATHTTDSRRSRAPLARTPRGRALLLAAEERSRAAARVCRAHRASLDDVWPDLRLVDALLSSTPQMGIGALELACRDDTPVRKALETYATATRRVVRALPALAPFHRGIILAELLLVPPRADDADERLEDAFGLDRIAETWRRFINEARCAARSTPGLAAELLDFADAVEGRLDHLVLEGDPPDAGFKLSVRSPVVAPTDTERTAVPGTRLSKRLAQVLSAGPATVHELAEHVRRETPGPVAYHAEFFLHHVLQRRSDQFTRLADGRFAIRAAGPSA